MIKTLEEYEALSFSDKREDYGRAQRDELPEEVCWHFLKKYPDTENKKWLLVNPTVPLSLLKILADDPDNDVRHSVADHPNISPELCEKLACDEDESVRRRIAFNPKTPIEVLKTLMNDGWDKCCETAREKYKMRLQGIEDKRMTPLELVQSLEAWNAAFKEAFPQYPDPPPYEGEWPKVIPMSELKKIWPPEEEKE